MPYYVCNVATTLAATGHPNVITLLDVLEDQSHFYLVLPYLRNGDLFDYMKGYGKGGIPVSEALSFFSQVRRVKTCQDIRHTCTTITTLILLLLLPLQMVAGLLFMKQQGLAHHDVSLENVGMTSKTSVQIIDLGMSINVPGVSPLTNTTKTINAINSSESSTHRTPVYLAPQRSSGKHAYVAPEVNIRSSESVR